ncbi:nucleotidyltransferase domain-containing protein [Clostridium sp. KNHs214]|uniref:type VII toxin-antitoxin system MntA family adenylyltransferase antitoxin n=1 Tax=Clostridium sp. KNHs214 TaxID=1540257 RepID=UPI000550C978|nr:nucleotidyltransferase domain-containing protein [Clostridium sp. KNHs214]
MIQKDLKEVISILEENLEKLVKNYNIRLLYIFGSYAKGKNVSSSDLDIGILLKKDYNPMEKLNLLGELMDIFKRDDIDLAILNSSNSVLKHQIIKYGKLVYMESEELKVDFEVKVLKEYMDMEYFRKTQMKYISEWIENNIGGER